MAEFLQLIADRACEYLSKDLKIDVSCEKQFIENPGNIELKEYNSSLKISGKITLEIVFCFETSLITAILKKMISEVVDETMLDEYLCEAAKEYANLIIGNTIHIIPPAGEQHMHDVPALVLDMDHFKGKTIKSIYSYKLNSEFGRITIYGLVLNLIIDSTL